VKIISAGHFYKDVSAGKKKASLARQTVDKHFYYLKLPVKKIKIINIRSSFKIKDYLVFTMKLSISS